MGSEWKYWDRNGEPTGWKTSGYNDASWGNGPAVLGYGKPVVVTTIGYGGDGGNKYPTAYFRKKVTIEDLSHKDDFQITLFVDDGAAIYVNETLVGTFNMPQTWTFNTYALSYNDGETVHFSLPKSVLHEGENQIAVEVHQCNAGSSDLMFDLSLTYMNPSATPNDIISTNREYSTVLNNDIHLIAVYEKITAEPKQIYVNEISGNEKWLEIYNDEATDVNLTGYFLQKIDENGNSENWQIPDETIIPAKGFLVWTQGDNSKETFTWGISAKKNVTFKLIDFDGNELDSFEVKPALYSEGGVRTVGRRTDGAESLVVFSIGTKGYSNQQGQLRGIEEILPAVNIYPNPTWGIVFIETGSSNIPEVRLYTLQGKLLLRTRSKQVDLSSFSNGVYLLSVEEKVVKMIKK
jgi:hypothetical protein